MKEKNDRGIQGMVEDACIGLYNISIKLECSPHNQGKCKGICPDRKSLGHLLYIYDRGDEAILKKHTLMIRQLDGELCISPPLKELKMCDDPDRKKFEVIHIPKKKTEEEMGEFQKLSRRGKRNLIRLVALLETTAALYQEKEVDFLDMFISFGKDWFSKEDDFNIDLLMEKFWNITYILLDGIAHNKASQTVLDKLLSFLKGLKKVYLERSRIFQQIGAYHTEILCGIEEKSGCVGYALDCDDYDTLFKLKQKELCASRMEVDGWQEFLFNNGGIMHPYREVMGELAAVLKAYLEKYIVHRKEFRQETVDELCSYLQQLVNREQDVTAIAGLENLSLASGKAVRADAELIQRYMRKVRKRKVILHYPAVS